MNTLPELPWDRHPAPSLRLSADQMDQLTLSLQQEQQLKARIAALEAEVASLKHDLLTERLIHNKAINDFMR